MNSVVDSIPEPLRPTFVEILAKHNAELLRALRTQAEPTDEQREAVDDIFSNELVNELGPGYEPTPQGQQVKRAIEEFWYRWPND